MSELLRTLRTGDENLTGTFDRAFAPAHNPWRHLGSLAFLCLVISVVSGIIAFALYDTSVAGAYESGRRLQLDPLLMGRLLRGLHRYTADAFMFLTLLHLLREGLRGHYRGIRWFSWITGIPLIWLLWIAGITGFWLLWDERALYSVNATAEWLQALPLFSDLLTRNFLTATSLTDRFFSLVVFMHIGLPLFLLAGVWIHIQRVSNVRIWPPKTLTIGTIAMFTILALLVPAESMGPANTGRLPTHIDLDWFYLLLHPAVDWLSAVGVWWLVAITTALLTALPFFPKRAQQRSTEPPSQAAVVDLSNCNGCSRCVADCPFGAVVMVPRTDGLHHQQQASVIADMCAACGICVGSCPSSTPFRRIEDIVSGIELPHKPVVDMRKQLQQKVGALTGTSKIMLFSCRQAADWQSLADASTAVLTLECAAMLPPSFIEYALRLGAEGVVIAGCRESDCEFRLGDRWVQDRMTGEREPRLRAAAPRDRIAVVWAGNQRDMLLRTVAELRHSLTLIAPSEDSPTIQASPAQLHESHDD
ncbi:cytochrome b N-terminal domain-containing protein [Candidatus Aalborgicola defluviihabitans]|uniref:cytochrome b N-terminal domain-containing protein n=1 Tax=Candidatus Aalborgicola defluviihabitans TaxID=3386187 RepID=UPI001EC4B076|nr:cytochrome b N-terminal domain-containing protein [Burkholderiales bacterium]